EDQEPDDQEEQQRVDPDPERHDRARAERETVHAPGGEEEGGERHAHRDRGAAQEDLEPPSPPDLADHAEQLLVREGAFGCGRHRTSSLPGAVQRGARESRFASTVSTAKMRNAASSRYHQSDWLRSRSTGPGAPSMVAARAARSGPPGVVAAATSSCGSMAARSDSAGSTFTATTSTGVAVRPAVRSS